MSGGDTIDCEPFDAMMRQMGFVVFEILVERTRLRGGGRKHPFAKCKHTQTTIAARS